MKIYTKTGDQGNTSFVGGERVKKNDIRIQAYGDLDELNSTLGLTITYINEKEVRKFLERIQHDIFTVCAELASLTDKELEFQVPKVTLEHIKDLEEMIDHISKKLPEQKTFILPGGTRASALLHLSRTVTRRVERSVVTINETHNLNPYILKYINRLSDLLYVLARYMNKEITPEQEPIYKYFKE
jgi:cob(I)alamin adenosyltransferase